MICESKPEVISIPMTQGNSKKYMVLRFRFLYQGMGSSIAMRWMTLSDSLLSLPPMAAVMAVVSGSGSMEKQRHSQPSAD